MISYTIERRMLQVAVAFGALVPIIAGASGMWHGVALLGGIDTIELDSHFRYLSGLLCGLGLSFWAMVPTLERQTIPVRMLTAIVFLGGLARLLAALTVAMPSTPMLLAIGMELIVTPLLCLWQSRIARRSHVGL